MISIYYINETLRHHSRLQCRKIIIATNIPSVKAVLQNGKIGVLCDQNAAVFANTIAHLIQDNDYKKQLQETIKKHTVSNVVTYQKINDLFEI